jgi:LysM repeat protein
MSAAGGDVQDPEAAERGGNIAAMPRRSLARFLAPLAIVAAAIALVVVISASRPSDDPSGTTPSGSSSSGRDAASSPTPTPTVAKKGRRTYTVKSGDTPSGIAEKTDVPLSQIQDLNPDLDPQALSPGTKLRLRR